MLNGIRITTTYTAHNNTQNVMIRRKYDEQIRDFLIGDSRSLLVTGARQVGKTFLIRKVGEECFDNVVEINFVEQPTVLWAERGKRPASAPLSPYPKAAGAGKDADILRRGAEMQGNSDCYQIPCGRRKLQVRHERLAVGCGT